MPKKPVRKKSKYIKSNSKSEEKSDKDFGKDIENGELKISTNVQTSFKWRECDICHENIMQLKSHYKSCKLYFNFMTKLKHGFKCKICKLKMQRYNNLGKADTTQARTSMYNHIKRMHPNQKVPNGNILKKGEKSSLKKLTSQESNVESDSESQEKSDEESEKKSENKELKYFPKKGKRGAPAVRSAIPTKKSKMVLQGKSKVVHEGNKPVDNRLHKCPDCDKNFPTPSKLQSHYCCGVPSGKSVDQAKKLKIVKKQKLKPKTKRLKALKLSLKKEGKMLREIGFRECGHKICMIKAPNVCGICGKEYIEIDDNSYVIENENIEDSDSGLESVEIRQEPIEIKQEPIEIKQESIEIKQEPIYAIEDVDGIRILVQERFGVS